jgi:5'-nucleotidase
MRILIVNDDGIKAEGLRALVTWARRLGEVSVFAPAVEQSGKSISLELHNSFKAHKVDYEGAVEAYAVESTPADCVRLPVLGMGRRYDLVLSGINRGMNIGFDINYSGTVGAVCEAAMLGMRGVALSSLAKSLDSAVANLDRVYDYFIERDLFSVNNLYNVNFPHDPGEIVITRQGGVYYSDTYPVIGEGEYKPTAVLKHNDIGDITIDADAVKRGYISISPLTYEKTNYKVFELLK